MIELMNMAILETNARRRVEVIADEMRAARARPAVRHVVAAQTARETRRAAGRAAGADDAPAAGCASACAGAGA